MKQVGRLVQLHCLGQEKGSLNPTESQGPFKHLTSLEESNQQKKQQLGICSEHKVHCSFCNEMFFL